MFYVQNVALVQKIWGGQAYAVNQKKLVDVSDESAYKSDSIFIGDVMTGSAKIFSVDNLLLTPINALGYINGAGSPAIDGVPMVRNTLVPIDFVLKSKSVSFTTGTTKMTHGWFNNNPPSEFSTEIKTLDPLQSGCPASWGLTVLMWKPVFKNYVKNYKITVPGGTSSSLIAWVGWKDIDIKEEGRIGSRLTFLSSNTIDFDFEQPPECKAPLMFYIGHQRDVNIDVNVTIEHYESFI
jgi:hypothetical protein